MIDDRVLAPGQETSGHQRAVAVSVVLPTRSRRESVVRAVRALLAEDLPDSEVVVVDDGSTDDTAEVLTAIAAVDPRLVLLRQDHAGKRAANALAVSRARGRVLLLLDDDVVPGPGLLAGHVRAHADRDDLVVVGYMPTVVPQPTTGADFATVLYAREYEGRVAVYEADPDDVLQHLWMGNVSLTRTGCERAGLARMQQFGSRHEDRDLGLACRAAGLSGVFDRPLAAEHHHSRTVDQFLRDCVQQGAGRAVLAQRRAGDGAAAAAAAVEELLEELLVGLPRPLAALVRSTRREAVRRPVARALTAALRAAAALPDVRAALVLAKLLRRVEHQHGVLTGVHAAQAPPSSSAGRTRPGLRSRARSAAVALVPQSVRRRRRYRSKFGRGLRLRNPQLFSEKVNWRVVHDRRPLLRGTCDKLAMKEHAERTAGDLVRVPRTCWSGTDVAELAGVALPERWVLKPNHRSGLVLFGEGPADVADLRRRTAGWTDHGHWHTTGEWAYASARPVLLVEEFLGSGEPPADLKVFVFDGVPRMVEVHTDRFGAHGTRQYTPAWEPVPGGAGSPQGPDAPRPERLAEVLEAASRAAAGFDMLRVDLYEVDGELWFGELTPYPGAGFVTIGRDLDALMGRWWTLPSRAAARGRSRGRAGQA